MWPKMLGGGGGGGAGKPPYSSSVPMVQTPSLWPRPHLHCGPSDRLLPRWASLGPDNHWLRPQAHLPGQGSGAGLTAWLRPTLACLRLGSSLCDLPESFTGAKADNNNSQLERWKGQRPRASPESWFHPSTDR